MRTRPHTPSSLSPTPHRVGRFAPAPLSLASRVGGGAHSNLARFVAIELAVWAALYGAYLAVRSFTIGSEEAALGHAWDVVEFEQSLGLFHESAIQDALHAASGFFSAYYMLGFFPLLVVVLVWLALTRPAIYRELRTALLVSIAFATIVFVLFPTAPPRLVDGLGVADTVGLSDHDSGSFLGIRFNPYAAVPSMHVGWSLLVSLFALRAARTRAVRAFFVLHPALMAVAVTATGNHYLLDAAAGVAVVCLALLVLRGLRRRTPAAAPLRLVPDTPRAAEIRLAA